MGKTCCIAIANPPIELETSGGVEQISGFYSDHGGLHASQPCVPPRPQMSIRLPAIPRLAEAKPRGLGFDVGAGKDERTEKCEVSKRWGMCYESRESIPDEKKG